MALYAGNKLPTKIYGGSDVVKAMTLGRTQVYSNSHKLLSYQRTFTETGAEVRQGSYLVFNNANSKAVNCVVYRLNTYAIRPTIPQYTIGFRATLKYNTSDGSSYMSKYENISQTVTENTNSVNTIELIIPIPDNAYSITVETSVNVRYSGNTSTTFFEQVKVNAEYRLDIGNEEDTTATAMLGKAVVGNMILGEGE